jgi:hypothetical protein
VRILARAQWAFKQPLSTAHLWKLPCVLERECGMVVWKTCHKEEQLPRSSSHRCVCAASELAVMLPQPSCWRCCVADIASDTTIAQQVACLRHIRLILTQTHLHQRWQHSRSHLHIGGRHAARPTPDPSAAERNWAALFKCEMWTVNGTSSHLYNTYMDDYATYACVHTHKLPIV